MLCFVLQIRAQGRGELLVSLCWQPAANRLTVVVLKARNLPKMDVTGLAGKTEDKDVNIAELSAGLPVLPLPLLLLMLLPLWLLQQIF